MRKLWMLLLSCLMGCATVEPVETQSVDGVVCAACREEGLTSRVNVGLAYATLLGYVAFHDESGRHHTHDPNVTTTDYTCTRGHTWSTKTRRPCWCGWPD